jgi:hypothetical protein
MVCMLHGEAAWRRSGHRLTVVAFLLSLLMRLSNTLLLAQCSIRAFTGMCVHPHLPLHPLSHARILQVAEEKGGVIIK